MRCIRINPADNVAVALTELRAGESACGVVLATDVPAGCHIDHDTVRTNLEGLLDYAYTPALKDAPPACEKVEFMGFRRADGQVGVRNQESAMDLVGEVDKERVRTMTVQKVDGDETEYGMTLLRGIFEVCSNDQRQSVPVSELKLGLKCGGSDGLSGTTVLTEVPEMFGAAALLLALSCPR